MSTDAKSAASASTPVPPHAPRAGDPDLHVAQGDLLVSDGHRRADLCFAGMWMIHDRTHDPTKPLKQAVDKRAIDGGTSAPCPMTPATSMDKVDRFRTPQNLLAMLFLAMFAFNLLVMALDFPRFSLVAVILAILFGLFFILWIGSYFQLDSVEADPRDLRAASTRSPTRVSTSWSS